jgi:hypothetical protein
MSWTDAAELAAETGFTVKQIKGYLATLSRKGLIYADEERPNGEPGSLQCLSEEGCDWLAANEADAPAVAEEEEVAEEQPDTIEALFKAHGYDKPRNLCRALRAIARDWRKTGGTRKTFLEAAVSLGLKEGNAAAEWQASTKRDD